VEVLEVHRRISEVDGRIPLANHIIRQGEDKTKILLCAIRFRR
jgi:hypothetical protein